MRRKSSAQKQVHVPGAFLIFNQCLSLVTSALKVSAVCHGQVLSRAIQKGFWRSVFPSELARPDRSLSFAEGPNTCSVFHSIQMMSCLHEYLVHLLFKCIHHIEDAGSFIITVRLRLKYILFPLKKDEEEGASL